MITRYELRILARCPVDEGNDVYECVVESSRTIKVEDILSAVEGFKAQPIFQEELTETLARQLGATVTTIGFHSGVKTTCTA
jgi:hypothetical protein